MSRQICTAVFLFPPPEPVGCGVGTTSGVVMTTDGGSPPATGTYWNLDDDTNGNAFTNPSNFMLEVGDTVCVNNLGEVVSFTSCPIDVQFYIDTLSDPATTTFPSCNITAALAQFLVNQNLIKPNVTITVTSLGADGIRIEVTIRDSVEHTLAGLQIYSEGVPVFAFESPFTCRRVRRGAGVAFPSPTICLPPSPNNPPTIQLKDGSIYDRINQRDAFGNVCYVLRK